MNKSSLVQCLAGLAVVVTIGFHACQPTPDDGKKPVPKTAGMTRTLHYFTWSDYVGPELIEAFERQHGVRVVVDTFSSNEELLAKLQSGATGYDVIVPSDFMAAIMMKQGLLAELDPRLMPNAQLLEERLRNLPFDPEQRYAVPYLWGTVGIGYDSALLADPPDSWDVLWDPRYKGKISMLNDQREVLGAALRSIGASLNSRDPADLMRAKQKLIAQKPLVKTYSSDHYDQMLATGEVILAHGWGGPVARAMAHRPSIKYVVPKEGGTIWADCLAVLKTSPNKTLATQFVNYLLDRDVGVRTTTRLLFAHANREAKVLVPSEIRNNPAVYAPADVLDRLEWATDVGAAIRLYERAWTELKLSALQPGETVTHFLPNPV
jgi:spermidine/putrescine-binding protein